MCARNARRSRRISRLAAIALATASFTACGGGGGDGAVGARAPASLPTSGVDAAAPAPTARPAAPSNDLAELRERILTRWLAESPSWARGLGLHAYDGKVESFAQPAIAAQIAALHGDLDALAAVDLASLSPDDVLDVTLLTMDAKRRLFQLEDRDAPHKLPQTYEPLFTVNVYLDRDYAPLESRMARLVEHEEAALAEAPHALENLKLPLSKPIAETAAKNFAGYATYLRSDVVRLLKGVGDPALRARFEKSNAALAKEADKLSTWLKKEAAPKGDASHVLGEARFKKLLEVQEGLTVPLADFEAMGEKNLDENRRAYEELSKTVKARRPRASDLIAEATKVMDGARQFIEDKHIVDLASPDKAEIKETPPYARWNAASLEPSGPFDTAKSAFYYVTLPDPAWPKKEQEDYVMSFGVLVTTTVHEVYPGHFVQARWLERAPTKVQKMSDSYSFVEGWAHYVEQMMLEEGFMASPETRLGQLSDALLRNCRFVVSYDMHVKGKSVEDGMRRFENECHIDKASAREQAIRGTFNPGYFAYTLGKLQILALRDEAKKKLGAKFSLRRFHDALLAHGQPPVALLHDRVLQDLEAPSAP